MRINRRSLRDDVAAQMICCRFIHGSSYGHGPEHVDEVLKNRKKYGHTTKSLGEYVYSYTEGGCGISG